MNRIKLHPCTGISEVTLAKLRKNESVTPPVPLKIRPAGKCDFADILQTS